MTKIPYLADGSIPLSEYYYLDTQVAWKPDDPFHAVIQLVMACNGSYSTYFTWKNVFTGATYEMTLQEFSRLINKGEWQGPLLLDALWQPFKRYDKYYIKQVTK